MTSRPLVRLLAASRVLTGSGRLEKAALTPDASAGPSPTLPEPATSLIPTVNFASAKGWPQGIKPKAAGELW